MAKKILAGNGWTFEPAGKKPQTEEASLPPKSQAARLRLEKRARGKEVTVLSGYTLTAADRKALAGELKKHCGSGGAVTELGIEIQGDHREKAETFLTARGWRVKAGR